MKGIFYHYKHSFQFSQNAWRIKNSKYLSGYHMLKLVFLLLTLALSANGRKSGREFTPKVAVKKLTGSTSGTTSSKISTTSMTSKTTSSAKQTTSNITTSTPQGSTTTSFFTTPDTTVITPASISAFYTLTSPEERRRHHRHGGSFLNGLDEGNGSGTAALSTLCIVVSVLYG